MSRLPLWPPNWSTPCSVALNRGAAVIQEIQEIQKIQKIRMSVKPPGLKSLILEASRALACLDADRLEELAHSCQALNRDLKSLSRGERDLFARQAREAAGDMATFARVLEATKANLGVMNRLRELHAAQLEYTERQAQGTMDVGSSNGNN